MIKGIILDIDGEFEFQGKVYPCAIETVSALRSSGNSHLFLTNSTLQCRKSCASHMRKKGFVISKSEIITAPYATANYLKTLKPRSYWVMLSGKGLDEFKEFVQDRKNPEYLVIGDNRGRYAFEHVNQALRLHCHGVKLIGRQSELVDTSMGEDEFGSTRSCCGS